VRPTRATPPSSPRIPATARPVRITARNARFQQWQALLGNRAKRGRAGEFLVQGVRPIRIAAERGRPLRALLYDADRPLSRWARELLESPLPAERVAMAGELLAELADKEEAAPELVAVAETPPDDLDRIPVAEAAPPGPENFLGVLFDRPTGPGNLGSLIRSADAFGAHGVIVTGHAADPYDPRAVRASTGSLFALPTVRVPSHREVLEWLDAHRAAGRPVTVVGTDEHGDGPVWAADLTGPTLLLVGNETHGLSAAWRAATGTTVSIPMTGSASSLNAANAATAVLYEIARQRHTAR
jgi:TrmH family RNA methyltransferase